MGLGDLRGRRMKMMMRTMRGIHRLLERLISPYDRFMLSRGIWSGMMRRMKKEKRGVGMRRRMGMERVRAGAIVARRGVRACRDG